MSQTRPLRYRDLSLEHAGYHVNRVRLMALLAALATLAGCKSDLLDPSGDVALQQRNILLQSTWLMLLIIIPVMVLTVWFAWRYRASNKSTDYEPDWDHSTHLELVIWSAPLLIVICLGALTWLGTHLLDPYRPIDRLAANQPIVSEMPTLQVDVVALDWKWLFIYPEYGVASVNELALPVNRPISMHITASSVMNSLYIPAFAGQVYAMPGMETRLHGVLNRTGISKGFSANYSGAGFSGMYFETHAVSDNKFVEWINHAKASGDTLNRDIYLQLAKPSEHDPVRRYASVESGLFQAVVNRCVESNKLCLSDMMAIDAQGGAGKASVFNLAATRQAGDVISQGGSKKTYVTGICTVDGETTFDKPAQPVDLEPLTGAGLSPRWRNTGSTLNALL